MRRTLAAVAVAALVMAAMATAAAPPPPVRCLVPAVKGKTLLAAKALIKAHLCGIGTITRAYSARVASGRVISQRPRAGVSRPKGTKISLVVSRGRG